LFVITCLSAFLALPSLSYASDISLLGVSSGGIDLDGSEDISLQSKAEKSTSSKAFVMGFNQAWLRNAYGSQWTRAFDETEARRMLKGTASLGGTVLRMWLFEGLGFEGVIWDDDPSKSTYGYGGTRTRPTGFDPVKLANIERFLTIAEEEGVAVYLTLFDANMYSQNNPAKEKRQNEWWNVLNGKYGAEDGFHKAVLGPILNVISRHRQAVFGFDLVNEVNALVRKNWFENGWEGARRFVSSWRSFIRSSVPDMPVTASFGHHDAVTVLLARRLPPSIVDFYDFHVYNNSGSIPSARLMKSAAGYLGKPIYLGEFGQKSAAYDDALQSRVLKQFVENARACGLAGVLAWRLSDNRPGNNAEARFSFEAFGKWRPAALVFKSLSSGERN
jgi:endo-1,4-beta-mannosidase